MTIVVYYVWPLNRNGKGQSHECTVGDGSNVTECETHKEDCLLSRYTVISQKVLVEGHWTFFNNIRQESNGHFARVILDGKTL